MKKYLILALAVILTMGLTTTAMAIISGSAHDLRGDIPSSPAGTGEICVVCHTPHNSMALYPLWNHDETANTSFTMYSSVTLDGDLDPSGEPVGISKLCLGCHDGSTAVDAYGDVASPSVNISTFGSPAGSYTIGASGDFSNQHPISIEYPDTLSTGGSDDANINTRSTSFTSAGGTGSIADVLEGDLLQCSTCHDVHNTVGEIPSTGASSLLRGTMNASALCLVCHSK